MMQAILVQKAGGIEELQLQTCAFPAYGSKEVLIQVHVAGINYIDIYTRTGLYQPPHYPYIPGKEGSGIVAAIGKEVQGFKVGDRVAFCSGGTGSYAEFTVLPAHQVVPLPNFISFETAAATMLQGLTAYYLSHLTVALQSHHTTLIHAGAGGVGSLLIQLAKLGGAQVITTVSTDEKAAFAKRMGADQVINYTQAHFLSEVMRLTQQRGVDVVYDAVGKSTFDESLKSLCPRGILVLYGQASGTVPPFELRKLSEKSLFLTRPTLEHYIATQESLKDMAATVFRFIHEQQLQITIGQRYPLQKAAQAHADLEARKTIGKSLLLIKKT